MLGPPYADDYDRPGIALICLLSSEFIVWKAYQIRRIGNVNTF